MIPRPVRDARQLRPAFTDLALTVEVMAVRGLLHGEIVPVGRLVVRPRYHAVQQVAFALRHTAEHAVDHRHSLSAGDAGVGAERAVRIARNPAERRRSLNFVFRPVTGNVGKAAAVLDRFGVEARADCRKLRTGDRGIGVKAVRTAALDDTELRHRGNRLVVPLAVRNIGKIVVGGQISVANVGFEQAEEDRCCFSAADVCARTDSAIGVTDYIGEMVIAVELVRYAGRLPACIDRLVAVHRHACDLLRQRLVGIPAGKGITLAGRGLVERHLRAGGTALILVSRAAVRLIVQGVPGRMAGRAAAAGAAEPVDIGHISGNAVRVGVRCLFPAAGDIFVSRRREHDLRYIACVQRAARGAVRLRIEHDRYGLVLCCAARPCAVDDAERDGGIFCPVCIQGFGAVHRVFKIRPNAAVGRRIPAEEGIAVSDRRTFRRNLIGNFHIVHGLDGLAAAPCAAVGVERHDRPPLGDEGQIGAHRHIQNIRIGIEKVIQIPVLEEIVGRLTGNRGRQAYAFLPQGRAVGNRICKNNGLFVRIQVSAFGPFIIRAKRYGTGIMCPFAVEVDVLIFDVNFLVYALTFAGLVIIPARERPALYVGNRFDRIRRILGHCRLLRENGGSRVFRAQPVISDRAAVQLREGIGIDIVFRLADAVGVRVRVAVPRAGSLVVVDRSHTRRHVFRRQRSEAVAQIDGNGLVRARVVRPFAVLHLEGHGLRAEPRPAAVKVGVCGQILAALFEFLRAVGILVPAVELEAVRRRRSRLIVTFSVSVKRKAQRGRRRDFIAVPVHRDDRAGPVKRDLNLGQPAAVQLEVAAERREHSSGVFDVGLSAVFPRLLSLVDRLVPQAVPAVEFQVQVVHGHCVLRRRGRLVRRSARGVLVFGRINKVRRPAPDPCIVDADRVGDGDDDLLAVICAPDLACLRLRRNRQNVQRGLDGVAAADVRKALFGMAGGRRLELRRFRHSR